MISRDLSENRYALLGIML